MDYRELKYMLTIADTGSITNAAKKLYVSQPALSHLLSKLETELGVKLFERNRSPLVPTYAGERYLDTARKILALNENFLREMIDICNCDSGKIELGITRERSGYMLPPVLREFRKRYPKVQVQTWEEKGQNLMTALQKRELNFIILPVNHEELPVDLTSELIYREYMRVVASPSMITPEMLRRDFPNTVILENMGHLPFIQHKKGQVARKWAERTLRRHGIAPTVVMETSSCVSAAQIAASGHGFTIVPQRAVDMIQGKSEFGCYFYEPVPERWEVNVIYQKDTYFTQMERCFIDLMKESFADRSIQ